MPHRFGFEPQSGVVDYSPADPFPARQSPMTEREAVVLLAEWFERGYDEVEAALRRRMERNRETVDMAMEASVRVGCVFTDWMAEQ